MKRKTEKVATIACMLVLLSACGMSPQDRQTLRQAGIGSESSYVVTGNGWGSAAGAVGGGYIGRQLNR